MPTYSEEILRLAELTPVPIAPGTPQSDLANQLCGDRISVAINWNNNLIERVEWHVEGCAILRASAAYLARCLAKKTRQECSELLTLFSESFEKENTFRTGALSAIYKLPPRYKCALLPWQACENLLRELKS